MSLNIHYGAGWLSVVVARFSVGESLACDGGHTPRVQYLKLTIISADDPVDIIPPVVACGVEKL